MWVLKNKKVFKKEAKKIGKEFIYVCTSNFIIRWNSTKEQICTPLFPLEDRLDKDQMKQHS